MNTTVQIQIPGRKPSGVAGADLRAKCVTAASRAILTVNVRKMCARAISLARRKSVTLAAISATSCYAGALLGYDQLTYTAAFVALGFASLADSTPAKGGSK